MIIRKANKNDANQIKQMMRNLFLKWDRIDSMDKIDNKWFLSQDSDKLIEKRISKSNSIYFVAEENKKLAGYIYMD